MNDVLELNKSNILELLIDRIDTPIGEMIIVADHDGNLRAADWTDYEARMYNLLCLHYGKGHYGKDGWGAPSIAQFAMGGCKPLPSHQALVLAFVCSSSMRTIYGCPIHRAVCDGWDVNRCPAIRLLFLPLSVLLT
jgi:hypothetical protein